jgi:hypothetical protein
MAVSFERSWNKRLVSCNFRDRRLELSVIWEDPDDDRLTQGGVDNETAIKQKTP